jgi:urate oxidase
MPDDRLQFDLDDASYGKDGVRVLISVTRPEGVDGIRDLSFSVRVWGPFEASYRSGDNTEIVPSDSLRRHLLRVAASQREDSPELICAAAAAHIQAANPSLAAVDVESYERVWEPIGAHSAVAGVPTRFASARLSADGRTALAGGVDELQAIATCGSAFTGFRRDRLTVQQEAVDRPLCGTLWARWSWLAGCEPTLPESHSVATELAAALADRPSNAIQELIAGAGAELLERVPRIAEARIRFAALPLTPVPSELAAAATGSHASRAHEVDGGPLGVTEARVRRA